MTSVSDAIFRLITPAEYWVIVVLWAIILALLLKKARVVTGENRALKLLVVILAIDAFRTLFENLYFGSFFTAYYGLFPESVANVLEAPTLLAVPKLFNIAAGLVVLFILIRRWFPLQELERSELSKRERENVHRVYADQLKKERASLVTAQAVAKIGSWETDLETLKITWSAETFRIFGVDPATFSVTHENFLALVHAGDRAVVDEAFRKSFDTREVCTVEHRVTMPDGLIKIIIERWQTYVGVDGKPARAIGICQDITDTRTQTEQLTLLQTAISRLNDIVLITEAEPIDDTGPRIVYVNEAFTKSTGYSREEVLGKTPRILQGAKTQRAELTHIRNGLMARQPVQAELINYTKAGEEYWLELDIVPIINEVGDCTHFVAVERDITARKSIEKALAESEQRFRTVATLTADIVWDWDLIEDNLWRNEAGMTRFGAKGAKLTKSQAWKDCIHPADRGRVLASLYEARESGASNWSVEYRYLLANGSYAEVWARGSIIRNEAGHAIRIVGSTADVTKQRELEQQLRQAQKMEAVGQLTGGVAHDFNNILMVIMTNVDSLEEDVSLAPALLPQIKEIGKAGERAAALTRQLLAFSRKQPLQPESINVNELVASMVKLLGSTLGAQIDIRTNLAADIWNVSIDRAQLESAVINLSINARDAMPGGGRLLIRSDNTTLGSSCVALNPDIPEGDYVVLSVTDSGTGMSPEVRSKVFEPFFTTKEVGKGTGLGLSMVYGFIKQSKGHIEIQSEVGRGTTIKLYIPRAEAEAEVAAHQQGPSLQGRGERILVVEDEPQVRAGVVQMLNSLNYIVTDASDGIAGLAAFKATSIPYDLLLTDVVMPGPMNGKALADEVMRYWPRTRVIFMSGYTDNSITHLDDLDAELWLLSKPFRKSELAYILRQALDVRGDLPRQ